MQPCVVSAIIEPVILALSLISRTKRPARWLSRPGTHNRHTSATQVKTPRRMQVARSKDDAILILFLRSLSRE